MAVPSRRSTRCDSPRKRGAGFTLVEVMLVIGILAIVGAAAIVGSTRSIAAAPFSSDRETLVAALQRARVQAVENVCVGASCTGGRPHGVHIEQGSFTVFQGDSYDTRDRNADARFAANGAMEKSGLSDVIFQPRSATTLTTGDIIIQDAAAYQTVISIGGEGQISWTR